MPRTAKGARLVWRDESRKSDGSLRNRGGWFIRDGSTFVSAGGGEKGSPGPDQERALADHIAAKYRPARERGRDLASVKIADAVNVYLTDVAPKHAAPRETAARLLAILDYAKESTFADINGQFCRDFVATQVSEAAARRKLEDLRAAVNHYHAEGYVTSAPAIPMPAKAEPRTDWLTRDEAARLLRAAWRMRQTWKGRPSDRRTGRHVARFILVGLYTGTRSAAICGAATRPTEGKGFVDYERGVFYRREPRKAAARAAEARARGAKRPTKKRQPPVRLPDRLLAHLRRWKSTELRIKTENRSKSANIGRNISEDFVVEWNGRPVKSIKKAWARIRKAAGLGPEITPHILRHTAATWMMQAGVEPWMAAGFLGMTVEVLIGTYGHHHPDFQAEAANALSTGRGGRGPKVVDLASRQMRNRPAAPHAIPTEKPETNVNRRDRTG